MSNYTEYTQGTGPESTCPCCGRKVQAQGERGASVHYVCGNIAWAEVDGLITSALYKPMPELEPYSFAGPDLRASLSAEYGYAR